MFVQSARLPPINLRRSNEEMRASLMITPASDAGIKTERESQRYESNYGLPSIDNTRPSFKTIELVDQS